MGWWWWLVFAMGIANAVTCHGGATGGDGFVSQLCTLLNVETSGTGDCSSGEGVLKSES